jgi:DNA-binding response OmpR family regulator
MPHRAKILILENDDFLREILGNLLHKEDFYILNGSSIERGIEQAGKQHIDRVIVGSSCEDFKGKQSINYLRKHFSKPRIFLVNDGHKSVPYLPKQDQILTRKLSVQKILDRISE